MHEDGRWISGTLTVPAGTEVVSPLPLPDAPDDLNRQRTFPGAPDAGEHAFHEVAPGVWSFTTRLPKRFGGVGATGHGTYANGAFYPQPVVDGHLPELDWTAAVELPAGRTGALGATVGSGRLTWTGCADRLVLASPRRARVARIEAGDRALTLVGKGRPRAVLARHAERLLPSVALDGPWEAVLVEAPLRRRLVRPGPGVGLVSDQIWRVFPIFQPFHHHAFLEGVAATASGLAMPLERELVGIAAANAWRDVREGTGAAGFARTFAWVPTIDLLLSSRRMAFYAETLEEVLPSDPVRDDLFEVLDPHRTGRGAAAQLDDRYGPLTSRRVASGLRAGLTLPQALQLVGADPALAHHWRGPARPQDYELSVDERARVTRRAPPDAPPETLVVRVDGHDRAFQLHPGQSLDLPRPNRIALDPHRHVPQTSRMRDAWPQQRLRVVASAGIDSVNLTRFRVTGAAVAWLRGRYDTRNVFTGQLFSTRVTLVGARLGWARKFGPLVDGLSRRHRFTVQGGPSVVDPLFLALDDGPVSLAGTVGWSWDTRVSTEFPVDGQRLSAALEGGFYPGSDARWTELRAAATGLWSPHPRHVVAGRLSGAAARATRADQLLGLAGLDAMRALPLLPPCAAGGEGPCAPVASERAVAIAEYRVAPLRGLSVPAGFGWGTELQLTAGMEGLLARIEGRPASAVGATAGMAVVGDVLGVEPRMLGVTAGWLLAESGVGYAEPLAPVPEVWLRWSQAF